MPPGELAKNAERTQYLKLLLLLENERQQLDVVRERTTSAVFIDRENNTEQGNRMPTTVIHDKNGACICCA